MFNLDSTSSQTLKDILSKDIIYEVPMFQRNYSWTEEIWEDLWQDIIAVIEDANDESFHYMGYLVLQKKNGGLLKIIDGQQRLATLSIIILAVLKMLRELADSGIDSENNRQREKNLYQRYIGFLDPVTLISKLKLHLNRNNHHIYEKYISSFQELPSRHLNASEKLIKKAWHLYYSRLNSYFSTHKDGVSLATFIERLTNKLFFTVITVQDEINAYKVFETLNARGLQLSPTDLLKNYLFSVISEEGADEREINEVEDLWTSITTKLEDDDFSTFLRVYWNSRYDFVRKNELYGAVRKTIHNRGDVFSLLRDLNKNADFYAAFKSAEDELWSGQESVKTSIGELELFKIKRTPYPLMLAARNRYNDPEFARILRACMVISFRYNVIGRYNPSEQEKVYSQTAREVSDGKLTAAEAIKSLAPVYPGDEKFRNDFSEASFDNFSRNRRLIKYIMFALEKQLYENDFDYSSAVFDVEHIMPKNPGEKWTEYNEKTDERFITRLGNLTILKKAENRQAGNDSFEEKRKIYTDSTIKLTQSIAEDYEKWNPDSIAKRQKQLAKAATSVWRIDNII
ncbi:MAG: DUF262 domain-containing HNH endonuclease family protein [Firmicutes bacterium]|nr:DUF262 domain-containing HNH endonuclease family protein [Bacillota bacterium]